MRIGFFTYFSLMVLSYSTHAAYDHNLDIICGGPLSHAPTVEIQFFSNGISRPVSNISLNGQPAEVLKVGDFDGGFEFQILHKSQKLRLVYDDALKIASLITKGSQFYSGNISASLKCVHK